MNRKPLFIALPLLFVILSVSCKKDVEKIQKTKILTDSTTVVIDSAKEVGGEPLEKTKTAFQNLDIYRAETVEKLKNCTKEQGNKIYEEYKKKCEKIIGFLNQAEEDALSDHDSFYDHEKKEYVFPDGVKMNVKEIGKSDVEFWEVGEGYAEIRFKPYHYYNLFKGKVTEDYEYFLRTEAKENTVLYAADAGLIISFKELGDRVLNWEYFITKYPKSPLFIDAKKLYQEYAYFYILGMDNTPTAEWVGDREIYAENMEEFQRFIAKNPKSDCTRVVKLYLEHFRNGTSYEDMHQMVKLELGIIEEKEP